MEGDPEGTPPWAEGAYQPGDIRLAEYGGAAQPWKCRQGHNTWERLQPGVKFLVLHPGVGPVLVKLLFQGFHPAVDRAVVGVSDTFRHVYTTFVSISAAAVGIVSGLAATGINQVYKQNKK